jgi:hypothetical protein
MGSIITTIACCSGNIGENNVDEEVEDKITVAENVENDETPQIKIPNIIQQQSVLQRTWSETTLPVR